MDTQPQRKPRRNADARREAILDVAQQVFEEEGFAAASMSTIAARLGGSKGTLYNYFKSKEELFAAFVQRRCQWLAEELTPSERPEETRQTLTRLGRAFLSHVLSDESVRHFRMISGESERTPEVGRTFHANGPQRGAERMTALIADMVRAGQLDAPDPRIAAQHFVGLCQNYLFKARLCNVVPAPTEAEIEAEVAQAVDTFLRAFGPR
jgi:AcrR family transcriptional regulator